MEGQSLDDYPLAKEVFGANLPDCRERTLVHKGTGAFANMKATTGEKEHTLTVSEMPSHTHNVPENHDWASTGATADRFTITYNSTKDGNRPTTATGGGSAHNTVQPSIVCRYIAKVLP